MVEGGASSLTASCACACLCAGRMGAAAIGRAPRNPLALAAVRSASPTRVPCGVLCEYSVRASAAVGERSLLSPVRSPSRTRAPCGVLCEYFVSASEAAGKRSLPSAPPRLLGYSVGYSAKYFRGGARTRCRPPAPPPLSSLPRTVWYCECLRAPLRCVLVRRGMISRSLNCKLLHQGPLGFSEALLQIGITGLPPTAHLRRNTMGLPPPLICGSSRSRRKQTHNARRDPQPR